MPESKVITGVDRAEVFTTQKVAGTDQAFSVFVSKGEELPPDLADGEEERLEKLGVFAESRRDKSARLARAYEEMKLELERDPTGTVASVVNRPETPWVNRPPSGEQYVGMVTTPVAPGTEPEDLGVQYQVAKSVEDSELPKLDQEALKAPETEGDAKESTENQSPESHDMTKPSKRASGRAKMPGGGE